MLLIELKSPKKLDPEDVRNLSDWDREMAFYKALNKIITVVKINDNTDYQSIITDKGEATFLHMGMTIFNKPGRHIHWLIAQQRGASRAALEKVCELADQYAMYLEGFPYPLKTGAFTPTQDQLNRFYESFGFKISTRGRGKKKEFVMLRAPQEPKKIVKISDIET